MSHIFTLLGKSQCGGINRNIFLTLFRLRGGGGTFDATQDLNPLLLTNDCVYIVPTS